MLFADRPFPTTVPNLVLVRGLRAIPRLLSLQREPMANPQILAVIVTRFSLVCFPASTGWRGLWTRYFENNLPVDAETVLDAP